MRVGFAQFNPRFGYKEYNLGKIEELASRRQADLLALPEMCTTGYVVKSKAELKGLAEEIPFDWTVSKLGKIAQKNNCFLIVGMPEIFQDELYNSAVVIGPDGYVAKNQKSHLFLNEAKYFLPGQTEPTLFEWQGCKIGLGICYDYMFPEYWRTLALQGANLFCNTANFVYDYGFKMMRARALENGVFSICVNRIGSERGVQFKGGSEIVDNRGNVMINAGKGESVKILDIDLRKSCNKDWNPNNNLLKDRRPEIYTL